MFCNKCGRPLTAAGNFCPGCGAMRVIPVLQKKKASKAIVLTTIIVGCAGLVLIGIGSALLVLA